MKRNKIIMYIVFLIVLFPSIAKAETNIKGYVIKADSLFLSKPNINLNSCLEKVNGKASTDYGAPGKLHCLDSAEEVTILNYDEIEVSTIEECKTGFYKVTAKYSSEEYTGYMCADNIKANIDVSKYSEEFTKLGFPESYFEKLTVLKDTHPNWLFTPYKTNLKWQDVLKNESVVGISYIQVSDINKGSIYVSLDEGSYDAVNKVYLIQEGKNWYAANKETVAYYLDPRNFLVEKEIFMFENLGYNSKYQTLEAVKNVLKNTDLYDYSNIYVEAATYNGNNINPISLAASSRQEVVLSDGKLSDSANGSGKINDVSYYNVYNLGAFSSCENPIKCAIDFASGYNGVKTSYNRPWTSLELSIKNGASYIGESYINKNQNTLYFKKWNVTSNIYGNYSNQYMTNIGAAASEARTSYDAYSKIEGLLDSEIEFIIPIYEDMPDEISSLPVKIDEDVKTKVEEDAKKEEEENSSSVVDIVNSSGYKYNSDYLSNIKIGTSAGGIISKFKSVDEKVEIKITSIDSNGISKEINDSETLGTGDIISITSGKDTKTFRIVIYGDINGDGKISAIDYVKVKNYIMSSGDLSGSYKLASDINNDGKITAVDYVNIKNYIMGNDSILK